ncbi:MAG: ADP-ribosylation factor-like protein [Promethearchaeota archaeon]
MGIRNILKKIFSGVKKIVICGLDNSGKSTLVSFLQTGTFIEHTPTMGKAQTNIEIQGIKFNLVDMGGQKDFRALWAGEMQDAAIVLFMLDAHDINRFEEAKQELIKLSSIINNMPLIILANKNDLQPVASIKQIIEELDLIKFPSFEVLPISSKTGFGITNAFSKIYYKLTGKQLVKRVTPKALTIFNKGGIPLTSKEGLVNDIDILRGGLYAAIVSFVQESFKSELHQIKLEGHIIILKRTKYLMGSIVIEDSSSVDSSEAELRLSELLEHLENMCPELARDNLDMEKIDFLTQQFATNIFS